MGEKGPSNYYTTKKWKKFHRRHNGQPYGVVKHSSSQQRTVVPQQSGMVLRKQQPLQTVDITPRQPRDGTHESGIEVKMSRSESFWSTPQRLSSRGTSSTHPPDGSRSTMQGCDHSHGSRSISRTHGMTPFFVDTIAPEIATSSSLPDLTTPWPSRSPSVEDVPSCVPPSPTLQASLRLPPSGLPLDIS
ncbi:hypothetical protein IQ06DRAFT_14972 [Phaeosphaeriaceae sp. SRC1lsM3a]|nr:hypothetical protein IQ06DRAFT_14972 [Stagonospora sp. SRC1lsM3a]